MGAIKKLLEKFRPKPDWMWDAEYEEWMLYSERPELPDTDEEN